jgi:mono/diheme cytochrome c family protein
MRTATLCVTVVLGLVIAGCATSAGEATTTVAAELVEGGRVLYDANCAACHGSDLRGTDRGPSHLSIVYESDHHADIAFLLAVRNGAAAHHWSFGDMPPIDGLSDDDVTAITAYVRAVQGREGFEPYPP